MFVTRRTVFYGFAFMDFKSQKIAYLHLHANKEATIYKDVQISRSTTRIFAYCLQMVDKTAE